MPPLAGNPGHGAAANAGQPTTRTRPPNSPGSVTTGPGEKAICLALAAVLRAACPNGR
jgi:hypothetical protein